ncbi:MAG: hypothetical protein L0229_29960 [Blastocatellia bacterium]|nr:hypothetical protein [Blastocatellia bacterium]
MKKSNPPDKVKAMDTPEGHQRFIQSQWQDFAAFAWDRYCSKGRGAVVIDLRRGEKAGSGFHVPAYYVADESESLAEQGGWPNEEVAESVREYDPAEEVVFIFLRLDGDVFYYNVSDDPLPPIASGSKQSQRRFEL